MSEPHNDDISLGEPSESDALAVIAMAADGLLMPSESDYPFEPFRWPDAGPLTAEALLVHLGLPPETPVETSDGLALLDRLAAERDWHGEQERATAARFAKLRNTIAARLTDVVLYRVGHIQITVIIAGRDASGAIVGLRTTAIET